MNSTRFLMVSYYGALAEVFARRLDNPLSRELTRAVRDMQEMAAAAVPAGTTAGQDTGGSAPS